MANMKGPAIFLAQFAGEEAPFDTLAGIAKWAGDLGYNGIQIPSWMPGLIDLDLRMKQSTGEFWVLTPE